MARKTQPLITEERIARMRNLVSAQLICDEPNHARRLKRKYPMTGYMEKYFSLSPVVQFGICEKGPCVLTSEKHSYKLRKGDIFIAERNKTHHESFITADTPYLLTWFVFYYHTLSAHQAEYRPSGDFRIINRQTVLRGKMTDRKLDGLVALIRNNRKKRWKEIVNRLTGLFDYYIDRPWAARDENTNRWQSMILMNVEEYLRKHLESEVTLQQVADRFMFSPSYLNTLFKKRHGSTIIAFLNYQRIIKASELLLKTGSPVTAIAKRFRYNDPYYFSRAFKKAMGLSPRNYRNRYA